MDTPTPRRVAMTHVERDILRADGWRLLVTNATSAVAFVTVPAGLAGPTLLLALARLRDPSDARGTVSAAQACLTAVRQRALPPMRAHHTERDSITLSDVYDPDARATSPIIASLAERVLVPHPLDGVAYADGTYRSRLPWAAVPT